MRFKTRLTFTHGLFAFILCALLAFLLDACLSLVENQVISSILTQEADELLAQYQEDPELLAPPDLDEFKGYLSGEKNVPTWLETFESGHHKRDNYRILIQDLDSNRRIYLVYDEARGVLDQFEARLTPVLVILVLVVSAVGIGLGYYQSKILTRPIDNLVTQVESVNTEDPEIVPLENKDEIGILSQAYADLVGRLNQYNQREKAFTRYASHELMTPLAIISNNLELLRNENISAELQSRAIDRLHEATNQMQRQIEVFLMLAREDQLEPALQPLDWNQLWDEMKAHFPHVSLSLEITVEPKIYANEAAVQVILFNIFGNVERHGAEEQGSFNAWLTLESRFLNIRNTVSGSEHRSVQRYGFGLEINEKLCAAIGWRFTTNQGGDVFSVTIEFNPDEDSISQSNSKVT